MSRRKKQPGFSPREKARESVRGIMRGINTTEHMFLEGSKTHAEKIDRELARIEGIQSEELREYLKQWLKNSQAAFIGAMLDFKDKLAAKRTVADEKATALMGVINSHKWDEIKDIVGVAEIELSGFEIDVDGLAHETLLMIIDAASAYEQRRECVRTGLNNNWTVPAIIEKLEALDAVVPAAEEAPKEDESSEKETVNVE